MQIGVILPAAGKGARFGDTGPARSKLEMDIDGRPVFLRAIELFLDRDHVGPIVLAVAPQRIDEFKLKWGDQLGFRGARVVPGGKAERWETVLNALEAIPESCTHVAVHDAARPLASSKLIDRVFELAARAPAVIPAVPVSATLKRTVADEAPVPAQADPVAAILGDAAVPKIEVKSVVETVDRSELVQVQTPQVFERQLLLRAYQQVRDGKIDGRGITDDAQLVEALGEKVYVVEGETSNLKITRREDLDLARAFVRMRGRSDAARVGRKRLFSD